MVVHHHRPSKTLTRVRQLRSFWNRLDSQTQKREGTKTRVEKKLRLNLITMKERKNTYTGVTLSTRSLLFSHETILRSQLHKKIKITFKRERKT